jgi:hypothetical protein
LAVNENYQETIAKEGGINTILSAMDKHPSDATVQHFGCAALWNIAVIENNQETIAKEGGSVFHQKSFIQCECTTLWLCSTL